MRSLACVSLISAFLLASCGGDEEPKEKKPRLTGVVSNPETDWTVSGEDEQKGLPPRKEVYKPDGLGVWQDNGKQRKGKYTGRVFFGPIQPTNTGLGAVNSKAVTKFKCGDKKGDCVVKVVVGAGSTAASAPFESLVLTLEKINAQGKRVGTAAVAKQKGNKAAEIHTLKVKGCGDVRLTVSFEETVNAKNPAGINTRFNMHISEYGCSTTQ